MNKFALTIGTVVFFLGFILLISSWGNLQDAQKTYDAQLSREIWLGYSIDDSVKNNLSFWNMITFFCIIFMLIGISCILWGVFKKEKKEIKLIHNNLKEENTDEAIKTKFCPKCGVILKNNPIFCFKCGYKLR